MSYGYRLNAEDIFFRLAEENFEKAEQSVRSSQIMDPQTGKDFNTKVYSSDEALASAVIAIVGYAASVEAFVNQVCNHSPKGPEINLKKMSTVKKAEKLLGYFKEDINKISWWPDIGKLYECRNELIHYKEEISYQGFESPSPLQIKLSPVICQSMRNAAHEIICCLGKHTNLRTSFLEGEYEIVRLDT